MKAFIIVALSISLASELGCMYRGASDDNGGLFISGLVRFVLDILAIIFVAIAM